MIKDGFKEYPHIPLIESMKPTKRVLLGQRLFWTHKKDGSNVAIQRVPEMTSGGMGYSTMISSRNQEHAANDIITLVARTEEMAKINLMLNDNPEFICYVEAVHEGISVTRIETYERDQLFLFDIFSKKSGKYLPYVLVHQMAFHYNIPVVGLWAETRHVTEASLEETVEQCLQYCKENSLEGMVIKAYEIPEDIAGYYKEYGEGLIMAKVKQDIPKRPKLVHKESGNPQYPPCPDSEVWGAIAKVEADHGLTGDAGHDMPLIATYVGLEQKKHLYSSPIRKLFSYWQDYLADMKEKNSKVTFKVEKIEGNPVSFLIKRAQKDKDWEPNPKIMMPDYKEKYLKDLKKEEDNLEGTTGEIE
jgi:hypothetical protein